MKKKIKWKIFVGVVIGASLLSLTISIPIIIFSKSNDYTITKALNLYPIDLKNNLDFLDKNKKESFIKIIDQKKIEKNNEIQFIGDVPSLEYETLGDIVVATNLLNIENENLNLLKPSIVELNNSADFFSKQEISNIFDLINIFSYYDLKIDWKEMDKFLEKHYLDEIGFFYIDNHVKIIGNLSTSYNLINSLSKYSPELFKKYFNPEKIKAFFMNMDFSSPESNSQDYFPSKEINFLKIASFLDEKDIFDLINKKNLSNWILDWDKKISTQQTKFDIKKARDIMFFIKPLKVFGKDLYNDLSTKRELDKNISNLVSLNQWGANFIIDSALTYDIDFLNSNNLLPIIMQGISDITNDENATYKIDLKNFFLAYTILSNLDIQLDKNKVLNHLIDRVVLLDNTSKENTLDNYEIINLYYLTLISANYFKSEFSEYYKLILNIVSKQLSIETSASNV